MGQHAAPNSIAGLSVGSTGLGLLSFTRPWARSEYIDAAVVMKAALDQGANFWNGGLHYGTAEANSLHLLKYYFDTYPEDASKVVLSIKGAFDRTTYQPDCSPEAIRASVEEAVGILDGVKKIDIFECARVDPTVPIEISIQALAELVKEGKIGAIGVSEANANTIRRAHAVHPIAAVEIELSLFTPDPLTNGVVDTCHELGIAIVAYGPVARGWLTGELTKLENLPANDMRRRLPRFQPEVFDQNYKLAEAVEAVAKRKGVTVAQVAIAWVRSHGTIPIPGSIRAERVIENCKEVSLSKGDLEELQTIMDTLPIAGQRYGGQHEKLLNQ
ncbi:NADP-dependent oxidoreductase domain-containing protein [Lasiosphaeria miniovina]|uniref:NADP-dependent oxidoreductase domain-containing protein n=1 Tax=Lasiosphaeria miniovina TaxID=1954250 RepID=A0AA40E4D4_9PEZI|nr:NADP-dependent oxidoreductase domain-containing protein [Lasiosphaeria miniovina]KAK0722103.1 NADP-dependent oxidoreductase domain-containing protein [Lasiosphaeria miniovina]